MIKINMSKARDIQRDILREQRKPLLEQLDIEFMQAVELSDTEKQAQIAQQKQELRDITKDQRIDDAQTPDDLKVITL